MPGATAIFSILGKGFSGAGKAEQGMADKPLPTVQGVNPVTTPAVQQAPQMQRSQNLAAAAQNMNFANQLAQEQANKSVEQRLNASRNGPDPFSIRMGLAENANADARQGDLAAAAGRAAGTASRFAGPGNAAQSGEAAGQAAYAAGQPGGIGVSAQQLANAQALVSQDTRDEQARQALLQGGPLQSTNNGAVAPDQQTMNYINANQGVPGNLLGAPNMSQQPNQSGYGNDLYQSSLAFR